MINICEHAYAETRQILLKIREYKKLHSMQFSPSFTLVFHETLNNDMTYNLTNAVYSILNLEENDEFVQIALINYYAKLFSCCNDYHYDWLTQDLILALISSP